MRAIKDPSVDALAESIGFRAALRRAAEQGKKPPKAVFRLVICPRCDHAFVHRWPSNGRPPVFCSDTCRAAYYRPPRTTPPKPPVDPSTVLFDA